MRLLADTHIALWAVSEPERLSARTQDMLADPRNVILVSIISVWEVAIKRSLSRSSFGQIGLSSEQALAAFVEANFRILGIDIAHTLAVEHLEPLHNDPFDRMIVAQALVEGVQILTHDTKVAAYSERFILV